MKTIEITAYSFSELSDNAKMRALTDYQSDCEYSWSYDAIKSLGAFMDAVGVTMTNYDIDWLCPSRSKVRYDGNPHGKFIKEDLTGAFSDYSLTTTWNKTRSIEDAVNEFLSEICNDYEYQLSEDGFIEYCDGNEIIFDENGNQLLY
jgi:hypothetical protein